MLAAPSELDHLRLGSSGGSVLTKIPALLCKAKYAYSLDRGSAVLLWKK